MPVAKHLSYARSRSRTERSRRIDGPSFGRLYVHQHGTARPLPQRALSPRSVTAAVSVAFRSIFKTVALFVESAGDILLTVASWMLTEILAGCVAYAMAMHGIPHQAVDHGESGDPKPSASPDPPRR